MIHLFNLMYLIRILIFLQFHICVTMQRFEYNIYKKIDNGTIFFKKK